LENTSWLVISAVEVKMNNQQKSIFPGVIALTIFLVVVIPFLPLLISRQWDWWEAWIYAITTIMSFSISRVLAARRHPDIITERARFLQHENTKPWDKRLVSLGLLGGALVPLVAGLEALINPSTEFSLSVIFASLVIILAGYALGSYAFIENSFFSAEVRIQADRDHQVVSSGPYRWIRHPGYAGSILTTLAIPLFLDSGWAFLPAVFSVILLIIRTYLEDNTLTDELTGYGDYVKRVRYRLLPGVW
jgi:protein-S-isoprenylcysteine O-methyltransferase Ste14